MAIPASLQRGLRLPVIGSPMFIVSNPDLVIAQCKAGVIGAFPALLDRRGRPRFRQSARRRSDHDEFRQQQRQGMARGMGCGAGVGAISEVVGAGDLVARFAGEYEAARAAR